MVVPSFIKMDMFKIGMTSLSVKVHLISVIKGASDEQVRFEHVDHIHLDEKNAAQNLAISLSQLFLELNIFIFILEVFAKKPVGLKDVFLNSHGLAVNLEITG